MKPDEMLKIVAMTEWLRTYNEREIEVTRLGYDRAWAHADAMYKCLRNAGMALEQIALVTKST